MSVASDLVSDDDVGGRSRGFLSRGKGDRKTPVDSWAAELFPPEQTFSVVEPDAFAIGATVVIAIVAIVVIVSPLQYLSTSFFTSSKKIRKKTS